MSQVPPPEAPETPASPAPEPLPRHSRRWPMWLSMAAVVGAIAFVVLRGTPTSDGPGSHRAGMGGEGRPVPVHVAAAQTGTMDVQLDALGTVTPIATVTLLSRVDGELVRVHFREGQLVKSGQLLAEIDPRPFQVQVTQAEGTLAKDQALLANARVDLERYRGLVAQDAAPRQQLDTQVALVRQYEATLKADQGEVDAARLQLAYTRIVAPADGRIGLRQVDAGNIVHAGDTTGLAVITQVQPITVLFSLPQDNLEAVLGPLRAGTKLPVEARSRDGRSLLASGELLTVDNQIDATTGTFKLKAQFANADERLFPNQFVNVRLRVARLDQVVLVPAAAIQRGTLGTFVYAVQDDGSVKVRRVSLGPGDSERVVASAGLTAGERVVTEGTDQLRDGAHVDVVESPAAASAPPSAQGSGEHPRRRAKPAE